MGKILGIVRASTERQEVESQKKELITYLHSFGYTDSQIITIESAGASAWKRNKKYMKLLEDIKNKIISEHITAVGLWNLDRLGRVDEELIKMKNWFIEHHIQLYCKSPSLRLLNDDGTVDGGAEIAYGVFASLVKQQTQDLFNKWKRGKDRNREQGKYNGGPTVGFGYAVDEDGYIVIDKDQADILVKLFTKCSEGRSLVELNEYLSNLGYNLTRTSINAILHKEKYKEIVGEGLFSSAQRAMSGRTYKSKGKRKLWLQKKIICPVCGNHYINTKGNWQCVYHSYVYKNSDRYCENNINLQDGVLKYMVCDESLFTYAELIYKVSEEESQKITDEINDLDIQINVLTDKLNKTQEQLDKAEEEYILGNITADRKKKITERIKKGSADVSSKIDILKTKKKNLIDITKTADRDEIKQELYRKYRNPDYSPELKDEEIYDIVQKVVSSVTVKRMGKYKFFKIVYINNIIRYYLTTGTGQYGFRLYRYETYGMEVDEEEIDEKLIRDDTKRYRRFCYI